MSQPRLSGGSPLESDVLNRAILYSALFAPLYLSASASTFLWERRVRLRGVMSGGEAALVGSLVGLAGFIGVLLIALLAGTLQIEAPIAAPDLGTLAGVLAGALLLAFQSGAEEWFFRGWLQPLLVADWGAWIGLIVTSLLFAAAHGVVNVESVTGFVNLVLAGMLFGLLALRCGSVWAAFAAHGLWNWLEQSVAGLTPNPGVDRLGSILDLKLVGSALEGAGGDGLNGALAVTAVFGLLIAVLVLVPGARATSPAP
ncbi:MAG TPA: CPBP family intramembrane glutamic endopeptidase [Rhizomicrobium sp.]